MNLQNLNDYCKWKNIDLFENCTVPSPLDIELVKNNIMKRCGLLRPVYAEPEVFKALTKMWFDSNQWNFEHIVNIVEAEYSPIENVYESDHWVTEHSGTDKTKLGGKDTLTHGETHTLSGEDTLTHGETHTLSGEDTLTHGETHTLSGTDTVTDESYTTHEVSAYNSSSFQNSSKDSNGGDVDTSYGKTDTASGDDTTAYGRTDTASGDDTTAYGRTDTASGTDETGYGKTEDFTHGHKEEYTRLRHGNIGVTTNDALILEELSLLEKFNPYEWIAAKFERDNFIQLY